ncbi:MAG: hypothetical protein LRY73_01925 [Bacillus sp. (in: Bacteria)]|nr:hypothetical protein [Bacillus sp. (in: firmicutes)]
MERANELKEKELEQDCDNYLEQRLNQIADEIQVYDPKVALVIEQFLKK